MECRDRGEQLRLYDVHRKEQGLIVPVDDRTRGKLFRPGVGLLAPAILVLVVETSGSPGSKPSSVPSSGGASSIWRARPWLTRGRSLRTRGINGARDRRLPPSRRGPAGVCTSQPSTVATWRSTPLPVSTSMAAGPARTARRDGCPVVDSRAATSRIFRPRARRRRTGPARRSPAPRGQWRGAAPPPTPGGYSWWLLPRESAKRWQPRTPGRTAPPALTNSSRSSAGTQFPAGVTSTAPLRCQGSSSTWSSPVASSTTSRR